MLKGGRPDPGGRVAKGNVYFQGRPVCDDGWGEEEALVACRSPPTLPPVQDAGLLPGCP